MLINMKTHNMPKLDIIKEMPFCLEDCIATLARYLQCDYELMFLNSWNFDFISNVDLSQISLTINWEDYLKYLEKWHGICLTIMNIDKEYIVEYLKNQISDNRPILTVFDSYWCPWDPEYLKNHTVHSFLIIGFDEVRNEIICNEPYYHLDSSILPIDCFMKGYKAIFSYDVKNKELNINKIEEDAKNCIKLLLCDQDGVNHFNKILEFGEEFLKTKTGLNSISNIRIWSSPIFQLIYNTIAGRHKYVVALKYFSHIAGFSVKLDILNDFDTILEKWNIVRGMLIKAYCLGSYDEKFYSKINNVIKEVANQEKALANEILQNGIRVEINVKNTDYKVEYPKQGKAVFANLNNYYNNKGFDYFPPKSNISDFTNCGQYYVLDSTFNKQVWFYDEMEFKVKIGYLEQYDNISCMGQEIKIPYGYYITMQMLISAEYGSYLEKIYVLGGEDKYSVPVLVYNWSDQSNEEKFIWKGLVAEHKNDGINVGNQYHKVYVKEFILDSQVLIDKIILPDCPNIHIFSITLICVN